MRLVPLTSDYELTPFDCGDSDLNEFLLNDAKKAFDFYRKNGFKELTKKEEDDHTRLMFFDMMDVL